MVDFDGIDVGLFFKGMGGDPCSFLLMNLVHLGLIAHKELGRLVHLRQAVL